MDEELTFAYGNGRNGLLPIHIDTVMIERVEPNARYKTLPSGYPLVCCAAGDVTVQVGDQTLELKEGSIFLGMDGRNYHYFCRDKGCRLKIIICDGEGVGALLRYFEISDTQVFQVPMSYFDVGFRRISQDVHMKNFFGASISFQYLIYELVRSRTLRDNKKNIENLKSYIEQNYCQDLDNGMLAEIYGTSVSYLCREFRSQYQTSPMAYVNDLRLEKARKMLVASRKKVAVIARECGFSNEEYFCYAFKRREQCTPLQYRKEKRASLLT